MVKWPSALSNDKEGNRNDVNQTQNQMDNEDDGGTFSDKFRSQETSLYKSVYSNRKAGTRKKPI